MARTMPRQPKLKACEYCGRKHHKLSVRQCLLGKRGQRGTLWKTLKEAVQIRDSSRCVKCGVYCIGDHQHMSHVIRGARSARLKYDLENVKILCKLCHRWWHDYEVESGLWFTSIFPDRWSYLQAAKLRDRQNPGTVPMQFYRDRFDELQAYIAKAKEAKGYEIIRRNGC